ncbi:MAG: hypothetical protein COV36_01210 [Alphaproteobacteria bacterium CG11_big_fil_rev_8_21_14_0_20_44_7]|nr:MAG: hypothetical protein COV36_01210 [Alphaproteobacteria bacterium CG11_big_fil_rev_8_21_14_0_20_44_7]
MKKLTLAASTAVALVAFGNVANAADNSELDALRAEVQQMKNLYEGKIEALETKISKLETKKVEVATTEKSVPASSGRTVLGNEFNPSIGVILNGQYSTFSNNNSEISGFAVGEEGERGSEGFGVDHTELNFSANVDDVFYGSVTAAIAEHEGSTEVELEEAYIQTLAGAGLPQGASIKAGRALWTLGYLNEHHSHSDDFADRPLPYRVFLDGAYNDDGLEFSYVLPTEDFYSEIGGGVFAGNDSPFGGSDGEGINAWTAYARVGGDVGDNTSWRVGASTLQGEAGSRTSNEDMVEFIGDSDLYIADARLVYAPTGNNAEQEVILQGEYFWRSEDGTYEDMDAGSPVTAFDDSTSGWYGQAVYKFAPQWRIGGRYSQLYSADTPAGLAGTALDAAGYDPKAYTAMLDWTNSEFSRVRLQANREELANGQDDNQFLVQYIMSLGAHGAHKY